MKRNWGAQGTRVSRSVATTLGITRENSSSPETCNDGVCSTTSPGEMTSVCTCYCKHEGNAARKKDNDITIRNGNRHPVTGVSKKSIVTNRICRESCKKARRVKNQETPHTNRSVEQPPSNPVLSPETSTALENAEEIINNAKIQLMEVCAMSSFDSARRNRNTYSDEPPWDNEMEERLYVRELVASKFHDVCSSRLSETNGKATTARSEKHDSPRVTVRRIDLSAPKFRVSRRRCADWSSLGYGSDDRSRGRASPARVPSKDSIEIANETTARDDRARDRRRTSLARGTTCEIQIGPSVHIVDRELTRQDLEDVHISPESSRAQSCANTATYTLHHDAIRNADDPEGTPRTRRARLDTLQREKPKRGPIIEDTIEAVPTNPASKSGKDLEKVRNSDSGQDDGQIECPKVRIYGQEREDRKPDPRDAEGVSECLKNASRGAVKFAVIGTDRNEKLGNNVRNENREGIASGGGAEIRHAEDGGIFDKRSGADCLRNDKNIVDKIQAEEYRGDRSKPAPAGDISRKAGFPRRANIASCCREAESPIPYRTIDEHFSYTFNSHNGQDGPRDVAGEDACRSFASDVSRTEDNLDEIDLYRPCLDDLDSILHSNDRKIERVVRAARNLSELLSGPEFAMYKLDEEKRVKPQDENREKLRDSSADKADKYSFNEPARPSILETELRIEDPMVSEVRQTDEEPKGANAGTGSSTFARENGSRSNYSKNSVESSVFPASDASDDLGTLSRDSDKAQRSTADARLSESSMDRSDVTTFSDLVPALSSTHTEAQMCRLWKEKTAGNDRHAVTSCVKFACKFPKREIPPPGKECIDGIFARLSRKDTLQATDRLVAYILQDEKQSVERKIASALKESAVTPATLQKLLDQLREAESIRDARQTETLDLLKNVLSNVKDQSDRGNTSDVGTFSRNVSVSSAGTQAPAVAIDGLTSQRAKIDASEIECSVAKNSRERLESPDERPVDFSECRETRGSGRSTARCESTQCSENSRKGDVGRKVDVAETVSIDAKNQTDKDIDENDLKKQETPPRNLHVAGSLIRTTSDTTEEAILRTRNNTSDSGLIADKFKDSKNSDQYSPVSPAFPREIRESVQAAAAHLEFPRDSENNSKNNSKGNSRAESLKQISDIRRNNDENPGENSERPSTKIAPARSREEREMEAADSEVAAVFENKDDVSNERLDGGKSNDAWANKDQRADKIITQTERTIEAQPAIKAEAVKEIGSEKTRDVVTPADGKVSFAFSEVSEMKNERVRADASPVKSKPDEPPTKTAIDLTHSPTREDAGSRRKTEINPRHVAVKEKSDYPADNCSSDPPRGCVAPSGKSSGTSLREVASRNRQTSPGAAGENNSKDMRNGEIRKSITFAAAEKDRDRNEGVRKIARSDDERQSVDLTERPRNYNADVLSSSSSSVNSTLLDHDDRSTNDMSSANVRTVDHTTPEMSHSEGELYMPSSCSYSLGEVRVLRRKCDLIEDNAMDRDSSVTVLVTRSMLTSLNDSTMSFLESSGRV